MVAKKDVAQAEEVAETAIVVPEEVEPEYLPASRAWDEEDSIDVVEGSDLESDKEMLVGVPFIITKVFFRDGKFLRAGESMPADFVSVEIVTAPAHSPLWRKVERKRASYPGIPEETEIGPDEQIVINDSSTGIKRQVVQYLHAKKLITVGDPDKNFDETVPRDYSDLSGVLGTSPFDADRVTLLEGSSAAEKGISVRLKCPRGMRVSTYENDFTPEGKTFYLA
jgi:hypothetical protein